jgi:hypothetical protein
MASTKNKNIKVIDTHTFNYVSSAPQAIQSSIIDTFHSKLNSRKSSLARGVCSVIQAQTGAGKTHNKITNHIPAIIDRGVARLIIATYPFTECLDEDTYEHLLRCNLKNRKVNVVVRNRNETEKIASDLQHKDSCVVLLTTHQSLMKDVDGDVFMRDLLNGKYNKEGVAVFIDELHCMTTSSLENYRNNTGNSTPVYDGVFYNLIAQIAKYTPYIFGYTATPTKEHNGTLATVGDLRWEILNDYIDPKDLVDRAGWLNTFNFYDNRDVDLTESECARHVDRFSMRESNTDVKHVMMLCADQINARSGYTLNYVLDLLIDIIKKHKFFGKSMYRNRGIIAVMTGERNVIYSATGSLMTDKYSDAEIIKDAASLDGDIRFVICVQKGKMGMNIHNLKDIFSFKCTNARDEDRVAITIMSTQLTGRAGRPFVGIPTSEFKQQYEYNIAKYLITNPNKTEDVLRYHNSYDVCVPDNVMWRDTYKQVHETQSCNVSHARAWISTLAGTKKSKRVVKNNNKQSK